MECGRDYECTTYHPMEECTAYPQVECEECTAYPQMECERKDPMECEREGCTTYSRNVKGRFCSKCCYLCHTKGAKAASDFTKKRQESVAGKPERIMEYRAAQKKEQEEEERIIQEYMNTHISKKSIKKFERCVSMCKKVFSEDSEFIRYLKNLSLNFLRIKGIYEKRIHNLELDIIKIRNILDSGGVCESTNSIGYQKLRDTVDTLETLEEILERHMRYCSRMKGEEVPPIVYRLHKNGTPTTMYGQDGNIFWFGEESVLILKNKNCGIYSGEVVGIFHQLEDGLGYGNYEPLLKSSSHSCFFYNHRKISDFNLVKVRLGDNIDLLRRSLYILKKKTEDSYCYSYVRSYVRWNFSLWSRYKEMYIALSVRRTFLRLITRGTDLTSCESLPDMYKDMYRTIRFFTRFCGYRKMVGGLIAQYMIYNY